MEQENKKYAGLRFPGQKQGEQIRLLIRKHWIIDVKIAFGLFIIGVIPLALALAMEAISWDGKLDDTFLTIFLVFGMYFLGILLIAYVKWLDEELDIVIATDQRVISHEQIDTFHRQISEANIAQIQDVTGIQKGFFPSVLHYGTLEIQTSGSDIFFIIKYVQDPYENARALLDLRDAAIEKENENNPA